ncbi:L-arabinose 1-dehydrogenase (NAD(P)(+)) [uncultured archaeon]|nr:L-arabinose 1-dehydrogenase (NAD(P)(+)) [uncultured archaeon]
MIIVTGGSGFIGSHLCSVLSEKGDVRIVDVNAPPMGVGAEFVQASVLDAARLARLMKGADAVVHLAALVDVSASVANPFPDFEVNALGTLNVLEAARKAGVKKVAYASSAAVYGNPVSLPIDEAHPVAPLSPYGLSKLTAERYVLLYNELYGMQNTALRLFNVYGSGQNAGSPYSGVITKFCNAIADGRQPVIYGDGEQTRDFVHVDDVAHAFCLALDSRGSNSPINIASGKEISVLDLLEKMCSLAGKSPNPKFLSERPGEIKRSVAGISLARKRLGYYPKMELDQGLTELVNKKN